MNREIKFRGKRIDNGNWVYGDLIHDDLDFDLPGVSIRFNYKEEFRYSIKDVIPETVGEYTGLKDKKQKDIYEGDLVRTYVPEEGKLLERIIYENGSFRVNCLSGDKIDYPLGSILSKYIEVVGNIYQNPELLEEAK